MQELHEILSAMVAQKEKVRDRRELLLDMADRIVKTVSQEFSCKQDEVAILLLSADGRHLHFVAPRRFADLGTIPVTKRDSIAVGVLSRRAGDVINNVPMVKHVSFFESIKLRDKPAPIQKMISTPLVVRGQAIGVAQISRKGETPREAGPDFTSVDLRHAQEILDTVAHYLAEARPPEF
jgi:GAF domain-containing protein